MYVAGSPVTDVDAQNMDFPYVYRLDRQGRKGQACKVLARGTKNSRLVEFEDGYRMVTSGYAIKRRELGGAEIDAPQTRNAMA